ncbi:MAG: GerMN domain-containing protein [Clostridiales bacterium]|nr:GerMN domain-containing protein [Clostridiales bacterium]
MLKRKNILFICVVIFLLAACSKDSNVQETSMQAFRLFYFNKTITKLVSETYEPTETEPLALLGELLDAMRIDSTNLDYRQVIPTDVKILDYYIDNKQAYIIFDNAYLNMDSITEVLCRAAIMKTITQIPEIEYVSFLTNDQPLLDSHKSPIGAMRVSDFTDDTGGDINTYERVNLKLYFTNSTGDKLIEETREVVHSNTISMEKLVIEQLILGPSAENLYPVLPSETKLISVIIKDGTCYVNFDKNFLTGSVNARDEVPIYSIVNSLVEIQNINKVQIAIEGETNKKYRETISLDNLFSRNLDLVEVLQEETSIQNTEKEGE